MTTARDNILRRLVVQQATPRAGTARPVHRPVDPMPGATRKDLVARFIEEAEHAAVTVKTAFDEEEAFSHLKDVLKGERRVLGWAARHIPLRGYETWLATAGMALTNEPAAGVRYGITGADAALATTGSLLLLSGPGKLRCASLLPDVHIAVVDHNKILPNLEGWLAAEKGAVRESSNLVIITGPSRTADIGLELVMGAHGPRELVVILV